LGKSCWCLEQLFAARAARGIASAVRASRFQGPVPSERFGKPAETASVVVIFALDESAFTVGSALVVDEGLSL
jgi:NAD(P)-dependent dehydrogenase (short-subunit alcohol dehydrogenase family)